MTRSARLRSLQISFAFLTASCFAGAVAATWTAPAKASRRENPVPRDDRSVTRGKQLYIKECVACHGTTGKGDGPKAPDLRVNPGDLSSSGTLQQTDGALFWKLTAGRTPMPAYRSLSEQERWMLVHYLRTLAASGTQAKAQKTPAEASPTAPAPSATASQPKPSELPPPRPGPPKTNDNSPYVSREEFESLRTQHARLKEELQALKASLDSSKKNGAPKPEASPEAEPQRPVEPPDTAATENPEDNLLSSPGATQHLLTGFAFAGFSIKDHERSFSAGFDPIFLWKISDRILFESELGLSLKGGETDLDLTRAQIYYVINDYMTLGAGKFLSPMNFFEDRLHQINKMPDRPLAIERLLPQSNVGMQLRGVAPIGTKMLDYAIYAANAPSINTHDPADLGILQFNQFETGDEVAIGGRVAVFLRRDLQLGYGFQFSGIGSGGQEADALLQSLDFNYVRDSERLRGTINVLAQWMWSSAGSMQFDPDGDPGTGPLTFRNRRSGGFAQIAYRPTMAPNQLLKRLEPVVRYEHLDESATPALFDEQRWSLGLNYWIMPSAVIKAAYQFGDGNRDGSSDAFLIQFKVGF
jgi:mono/diheme cytochrome c family protein